VSVKVVRVDAGCRPVVTHELREEFEERYIVSGPGWRGYCETGTVLPYNFVATEIAEYLGWDDFPHLISGWVLFAGEEGPDGQVTDVPDFVVNAAMRYTGAQR
jgi:hypothetical protein